MYIYTVLVKANFLGKMTHMGTRIKDLNEAVQPIAENLSPTFGLKNILSAGLVLLSTLSDEEMIKTIEAANGKPSPDFDLGRAQRILNEARTYVERLLVKSKAPPNPDVLAGPANDKYILDSILKKLGTPKKIRPQVDVATLKTLVHRYVQESLSTIDIVADAESDEEEIRKKKPGMKPKSG